MVYPSPAGSVVEHPLRDRKVVGSNPGRAIPKALKMVPVATLLGAQHYKASTTGVNQKVLPVLSTETLLHIWLSTEYYGFRPSRTAVDTVS